MNTTQTTLNLDGHDSKILKRWQALPGFVMPKLFCGCAENMHFLADESVDIIITSPPYNMGGTRWPMGGQGRTARADGVGYADDLTEREYQRWQIACLREMHRVARPGASLFYNHKNRVKDGRTISPLRWLDKEDALWTLRQVITWDRGSTHNHCKTLFWPQTELVFWLTKGGPNLPQHSIGMPDIWTFPTQSNTTHPAPFPAELPRRCLLAVGKPGDIVLDCFAGSCTTLAVAGALGYESVGVDKNAGYLERAVKEHGWNCGVKNTFLERL